MKGRTYRYFEKEALWEFGYGLSYTTFGYSGLAMENTTPGQMKAKVTVTNTGKMDGEEVVQLYVRKTGPKSEHAPLHTLAGYKRILLKSGESREVSVPLDDMAFMELDDNGYKVIGKGSYELFAGADRKGIVKIDVD